MSERLIKTHPGQGSRPWMGRAGRALPAVLAVLALLWAIPSQAEKKSYGYEDDPIRLGTKALEEGRLDDARTRFQQALDSEWKTDRARYGLAEILRRRDKYTDAERYYREALAERSQSRNRTNFAEANAGLGLVLYFQGRREEARKEFETALGLEKNLWNASYGMARILVDEKRYEDALNYLEAGKELKGVSTGEDQYLFGLALAQVGLGRPAEAEKNSLLALTLNPAEAEYGILAAEILTARNAPTLAIEAYERALATPGVVPSAAVQQNLAQLYERERRFNDALGHYHDAIGIDSTYAPAYKSAAKLYALGGQNDRAAQFYLRYTELDPTDAEGWLGQAEAFTTLGSNRRALEAAEKAYALNSEDQRIRLALARATYLSNDLVRSERLYFSVTDTTLFKSGDRVKQAQIALAYKLNGRADSLLTQALKMDPKNAEAYAAKGKLFLARQKPDSAVVCYEKSIELNPSSALTRINLGVAFIQGKRAGDAARVLRQAVAMSPDIAPAHIYLGQALVMADSLSAALAEYRRAMEIDPKSGSALRGAAYIYLKWKEYGQAESVLSKATTIDPGNADGWASLGSAQSGLNKIDEAIKSFEKALEISPNHAGALRGLEALKQYKAAPGSK